MCAKSNAHGGRVELSSVTDPARLSAERIEKIREGLLDWFAANARDLPWRRTRDPYEILVSEVMLQQTQVDRVLPYYVRFLERFPTVQDLASAPVAEVIRIWAGLGYNRRAVNLQRAAQTVTAEFGGVFPREPEALRRLPGVGAYTAGAIAAFAFEQDAVFVDTNMRRVVSRLVFGVEPGSERQVIHAAGEMLPPGKGWEWNQALIEFGALQCTARRPACIVCPLQRECAGYPAIQTAIAAPKFATRTRKSEPFEQTTRFFRGRIVDALRNVPEGAHLGLSLDELGPRVREGFSGEDLPWLREIVSGLERDGLAKVAEASPDYDSSAECGTRIVRVTLP
jgi:A/G-specific adenine glycosylase